MCEYYMRKSGNTNASLPSSAEANLPLKKWRRRSRLRPWEALRAALVPRNDPLIVSTPFDLRAETRFRLGKLEIGEKARG